MATPSVIAQQKKGMIIMLSNRTYDILKWFSLVFLDAIGLFYSTISVIWSLPYGDEVMKTCAAISLLLGTCIGVSSVAYKNGVNSND